MSTHDVIRKLGIMAALAAAYFASAQLGLSLATAHRNVSLIWPPTGIALAAMLLLGYWVWPAITLGAFLANAVTDVSLATAGGIAAGNTLESLAGAWLVHRYIGHRNPLDRVSDVFRFTALAALLSTMASATIGTASLCLGNAAPWTVFENLWWTWWLGDAAGALVVTPAALAWYALRTIDLDSRRLAKLAIPMSLLTLVALVVFTGWGAVTVFSYSLMYLIIPFLLWITVGFCQRALTTAILIVAGLAIWGTAHGLGPFGKGTVNEALLLLHTFMGAIAIMSLALAALITERKRAEEALRESGHRLVLVLEATNEGLWDWNIKTGAVYYSPHWIESLGYAPEEVSPHVKFWESIVHPDDMPRVREALQVHFERRTPMYECENRLRRKDGSWRWNLDRGKVVEWDSDGKPSRMVGTDSDITDRKQAEEALSASEKRLRTILEAEPECVKVTTEDGILLDMNPAGLAMIEADSLDQVIGQSVCPLIAPAYQDAFAEFTRRVYGGEPGTMQFEVIGLKGRHRWMDTHAIPLRDERNATMGVLAITRDVTDRKREENILQALMEGTASVTGEQFFPALVRALASAFGVRHALVTELLEDGQPRLRILAIWMGERLGSPTEYDLIRTPCEKVIQLGEAYYQHSVQALFPEDKDLVALGAVSYLGIELADSSGKTIGHLCILDDKPLPDQHHITPLLKIFASRAAAELERKQAEEDQKQLVVELAESRSRFEMFFRQTPSAIAITTVKDGRFLDVNKQAEVLTGYTREEMLGRTTVEMNLYVDPIERADIVQKLNKAGVLTNLERQIRTKSGKIRTAVFSLVPIQMGSEPCMLSIAHDITERKRAEEGLRERSRQQAIEAELSLLAVTVQDLPTLLRTAAELTANAMEVNYCEALELISNDRELRLCASAGWRGDRIGQVHAVGPESLAHSALLSMKPVFMQDVRADTRFSGPQWLDEQGAVGGLSVAIRSKKNPWGILSVYRAGSRAFSADDANFLQTISNILATAIERAEAEGVLRSANQALRRLSSQLLQVQESERRAIARDLHDEIGQSLTAIKLNVERAQRTPDRAARTRIMQDCNQITDNVLEQVRNLSLDLHPSILDDLGLAYALRWYADRQAERAGLKVEVTADLSLPRFPQDVEIACFRIVQEALTNVARHAKAHRVDVLLKQGVSSVEIRVQDDGVGFDADAVSPQTAGGSSIGLASMQERARLLGGTVRITSTPHRGTRVIATLPLVSSAEISAAKASQS